MAERTVRVRLPVAMWRLLDLARKSLRLTTGEMISGMTFAVLLAGKDALLQRGFELHMSQLQSLLEQMDPNAVERLDHLMHDDMREPTRPPTRPPTDPVLPLPRG